MRSWRPGRGGAISYIGHANYVGPKWETNDPGTSVFDDHGVQMTLLGIEDGMRDLISRAAATRDTLNADGLTHYGLTAYEGGPSGYWTNDDDPEIDELYGKSVAMGVSALDAWLFSSLNGYGYQCYLGFSSGRWWSSHTLPEACGFRPHAGWLALKLRNRYAPGDEMVETIHDGEPTLDSEGEDLPLISSYALRGSGTYAVFILSRKLDGDHDGTDFGDGMTPVTLHLPFSDVARVVRYRLERPDGTPVDPRANNRDGLEVVIGGPGDRHRPLFRRISSSTKTPAASPGAYRPAASSSSSSRPATGVTRMMVSWIPQTARRMIRARRRMAADLPAAAVSFPR